MRGKNKREKKREGEKWRRGGVKGQYGRGLRRKGVGRGGKQMEDGRVEEQRRTTGEGTEEDDRGGGTGEGVSVATIRSVVKIISFIIGLLSEGRN